jgi:hypothetical protein
VFRQEVGMLKQEVGMLKRLVCLGGIACNDEFRRSTRSGVTE